MKLGTMHLNYTKSLHNLCQNITQIFWEHYRLAQLSS